MKSLLSAEEDKEAEEEEEASSSEEEEEEESEEDEDEAPSGPSTMAASAALWSASAAFWSAQVALGAALTYIVTSALESEQGQGRLTRFRRAVAELWSSAALPLCQRRRESPVAVTSSGTVVSPTPLPPPDDIPVSRRGPRHVFGWGFSRCSHPDCNRLCRNRGDEVTGAVYCHRHWTVVVV